MKSGILCVMLVVTYSLLCLPVILFYTVVHHDSYYEVGFSMHDVTIYVITMFEQDC